MLTEREKRANRATIHFQMIMAYLSVGDWDSANGYLIEVKSRDGGEMYRSVCDMIAVHLRIPPMEQ